MIRRSVGAVVLLLGALALVGPAAPASAGGGPVDYGGCDLTVTLTDDDVDGGFDQGDTVIVIGEGFQPNFETTIVFDRGGDDEADLGTVLTDATGSFTTTVVLPLDVVDAEYSISADCDETGNPSSTNIQVSSGAIAPPTDPAALPQTGSDVEPLVIAGGIAVLAGAVFLVVARRRRQSHVGV